MNEKTDTTRNVAARVGQEYEKILANKEQEIDKYKCELREQEKTLDSVNRAWIALTHDYNKLFSEFHDLKFESDKLKNEKEATPNLWGRVTEQEKTIERLEGDLKLSELAVTTQMDRADRWGNENKAERERNEKLSIDMGIAQKEIIRLTERLKETEQLSGKRFHAIQELEGQIQTLERARQSLEELNGNQVRIIQELEKREDDYDHKMRLALECGNRHLESQIADFKAKLEQTQCEWTKTSQQCAIAQGRVKFLESLTDGLKAKLAEVKRERDGYHQALDATDDIYQRTWKERDKANARVKELERELSDAQQRLALGETREDNLLARALKAEESAKNWEIHAHWLEQGKGDWHDDPQQKEPKK